MKVYLMYKDRDFDLNQPLPPNAADIINDLQLETILQVMSNGDTYIFDVCKRSILLGLKTIEEINYRQEILKDCLNNPLVIRELYQIPIQAIENKRKQWLGIFTHSASGVLSSAVSMMEMLVELLKKLENIASNHKDKFNSEGFIRFFDMIQQELNDEYFSLIEVHLKNLRFKNGVLISAELGKGNEGKNYTLRMPNHNKQGWLKRVFNSSPVFSFALSDRDDAGARVLAELQDRGINLAANALAQSAEHIESFLNMLRVELAFYIGCINLEENINQLDLPICFPIPKPANARYHNVKYLYDLPLALKMKKHVVGNDINAGGKQLVIITGPNQGGKSTFLRSIGVSQLMMQAGMFVAASTACINLCSGVYTHFKRKEDPSMKSGKLDEELARMDLIINWLNPNAVVLFNESFAATNEREGSEIARQIVSALLDCNVKIFFVTHQSEFSQTCYQKYPKIGLFLRAERKPDGKRTYKLIEGEPLSTSFGEDIYKHVFSESL